MITTTEFFLFICWGLTLAYAFHQNHEQRKARRILLEFLENEVFRERVIEDFQLFRKSIIKNN